MQAANLEKGIGRIHTRIVQNVASRELAARIWAALVDHFVDRCERAAQLVRKCYKKDTSPPLEADTVRALLAKFDDLRSETPESNSKKSTKK